MQQNNCDTPGIRIVYLSFSFSLFTGLNLPYNVFVVRITNDPRVVALIFNTTLLCRCRANARARGRHCFHKRCTCIRCMSNRRCLRGLIHLFHARYGALQYNSSAWRKRAYLIRWYPAWTRAGIRRYVIWTTTTSFRHNIVSFVSFLSSNI